MGDAVLNITEKISGGACIIHPAGDIDAHTAPSFKESIDRNISAGKILLVFDFSSLNYISSAGIGILNAALHVLKEKGGKMSIACANKTVYDTLDVMYFTKKVPVRNEIDSSIREVTAP